MSEREKKVSSTRLHAIVHGRVQGVNFRSYTISAARQLELSGWVANRWDGTVETIAEGERKHLDKFLTFLYQGSPYAIVETVDARWEMPSGEFTSFRVRYL